MKKVISVILVITIILGLNISVGAAYENTHKNTGNQATDIIGVARTQIGYAEGSNNYTKYGVWYGYSNVAWCSVFIAWCANQAGISTSVIPKYGDCGSLQSWFSSRSRWKSGKYYGGSYTPKVGDIVFYDWNSNRSPDHVGLVESVSGGKINTIEGNYSDKVSRRTGVSLSSSNVLGFGVPGYSKSSTVTTNSKQPGEYQVNATPCLNIRKTADLSGDKIGEIPDGEIVNVTSVTGNWGKVTYNGVTGYVSLDYLVSTGVELEYITVTTRPTKTKYAIGEGLSTAGMVVKGTYSNGTVKTLTGYSVKGFTSTSTGIKTVTVTYAEKSTTFEVEVVKSYSTGVYKVEATGLNFRSAPQTDSTIYSVIPNGTIVTVTKISADWGQITYGGRTGWVSMEYLKKIDSGSINASISLSESSLDMYDTQTAVLIATTEPASQPINWTSSVPNVARVSNGLVTAIKEGTSVITASFDYDGKTYSAKCTVKVEERSVKSISVKTLPEKTNYTDGESLSTKGLVLTVNYTKGSSTTISSGFGVSGYDKDKIGTQLVTVSYGGKTATFTVKVRADYVPFKTVEYKGHIYSFYNESLSYKAAEEKCKVLGGKLVAITSADEQEFILNELEKGNKNNYWIGLSDIEKGTGKYAWSTGEALGYTSWIPGQPNATNGENAVIIQKAYGGKWNDVSATYNGEAGFICEIDMADITHSATTSYNGKTYYRFDDHISWNDAKIFSEVFGGHLVTISSTQEFSEVKKLAEAGSAASYWIGASDSDNNGSFEWVTGEAFSYKNWYVNAPDNVNSCEHYVEMGKSIAYRWNDAKSSGRDNVVTGFIVEVENFSISLDKTDITMAKGQTTAVTAKVSGGVYDKNDIVWTSADTSVAKVSASGVITAVSSGSTVIIAVIDGKASHCMVTVL